MFACTRSSVVHSMVEYIDGSVIAQMGVPDMRGPISYALSYPERLQGAVEDTGFVFYRDTGVYVS